MQFSYTDGCDDPHQLIELLFSSRSLRCPQPN